MVRIWIRSQFRGVDRQTQFQQQIDNPAPVPFSEESGEPRIRGIKRHSYGDSLAVPDPVSRKIFQLVRGPVTEIERARIAQFKRVTTRCDVMQMEFRAASNNWPHRRKIAFYQRGRARFDEIEKLCVLYQRDFDSFRYPAEPVAVWQSSQKVRVVYDRDGMAKVPR